MNRFLRIFLVFCLLCVAFVLRTYRINEPLADWHSWRQADTSAVARRFLNEGIDLLHPKYEDISEIPSGKFNPQGYRMVEFPIYNALHAEIYKLKPFNSFESTGRLLSIIFSLVSLIFIYLIAKHVSGDLTGLLAALFFAVLPYNIYYSRVILPEPLLIMTSLGSMYFLLKAFNKDKLNIFFYSAAIIFFSISLLLKPFSAFFIAPFSLYILFSKKKSFVKNISFLSVFGILSLVPFFLWRQWISQFPQGIPANMWLLNGDNIRFKGAWFQWLFAERIGRLILGYWGTVLLAFGILAPNNEKKEQWFYFSVLAGSLIYLSIVATGNVRHDYYQILIVPTICFLLARGSVLLLEKGKIIFQSSITPLLVFVFCFLTMEAFGWYQIRDFFNINHREIVTAGIALEKITKTGDFVIAPYGGDTAFLYQTTRQGWPIGYDIKDKYEKGADWYVTVKNDAELQDLEKSCKVTEKTETFTIINLHQCAL